MLGCIKILKKKLFIYKILHILREALPLSTTPNNNQSGFRVSGVWPTNWNIFTEDEFLPSDVYFAQALALPADIFSILLRHKY